MSEGAPQVNGPASPTGKFIDTIDPDDPAYQKNLQRPAVVKEDIKQMEDRSRVSLVLNSEAFRKELEEIIDEQLKAGHHPASLIALQQISDLLVPQARSSHGGTSIPRGSTTVIPVADIRGVDSLNYTKGEKLIRCKLAACYRLVDMYGWCHGIYNHISARINQEQEHFLINPFGLLYSEVTASSLVKIDARGEIVDQGSLTLGINKAGFTIHSAIHQCRPDIKCIIHLHTPAAVAVSLMKCGMLPLSQEALICGDVSYHDYNGIIIDQEERENLQRNLGPCNKIMFLRNHGVVACGQTVEEAFHYAFNVMAACEAQVRAMPAGLDNLIQIDSDIRKKTFAVGSQGGGGVDTGGKKWRTGEMEFEAHMRQLDNAGYRTGHVYRLPVLKSDAKRDRVNSDVEIPPSSSSFTYVFDGDYEHSKYLSPLKTALERQKQQYKAGWLNSPNVYTKQEIEETGTPTPKKYTKWVPEGGDGSPTRTSTSTPIKVDNPNLFAPISENPKEYKTKQKQIRKDYYEDKVTAGPQSKFLEGISWEEAQKLQQAEGDVDANVSATGDNVIVIGAASKGIIQKDHQHNVQVYQTRYAANPFENITEDDLETYKKQVEGGRPDESDEPGPDGRLISTDERIQQIQQQRASDSDPRPADEVSFPAETNIDEEVFDKRESSSPPTEETGREKLSSVGRSESARYPPRSPEYKVNGEEEKPSSPAKSDTLRSTDSASGGETLEDRSSKEGSPTKEAPSPTKEKKKKKKFRMPSFSKKKNKESKESTI